MQPLDLNIEQRVRRNRDAQRAVDIAAPAPLCSAAWRREEPLAKGGVIGERLKLAQLFEIGDPAVADGFGDQARQRRIGLQEPAPRRDAVGLVVELGRPIFGEIPQTRFPQKSGVQLGDAVDGAGADDGQVGHADDASAPSSSIMLMRRRRSRVERIAARRLPHKPGVDFVDDLQVARQQPLQHADGPFLQGLGQDRVVGVAGRMRW